MTEEIIFSEAIGAGGHVGQVLLNRPKALNACTQNMCQLLHDQLTQWEKDDRIKSVIVKGAGDRAFCAGGDIRLLFENKDSLALQPHPFFKVEYALNAKLFHFKKPYISLLNGITMGGGAGISIHGSHRVATEKLQFAMPETKIGFYPDIGSCYFLNRCPGLSGLYLALTGNSIRAADAFSFGIVNHVVSSKSLDELENQLINTQYSWHDHTTVTNIIRLFQVEQLETDIANKQALLDSCFNHDSIKDILSALENHGDPWCTSTAEEILERSPTSIKFTFERMRRGKGQSFNTIIQDDLVISQNFLHSHDFQEGVRAAVIDKDKNPAWKPSTLGAVAQKMVDALFLHI